MSNRVYKNSKDKIVDAATNLLVKHGLSKLTTEAAIKASGLSKAGFFYNFKTKEDLIIAVFEKLTLSFLADVSAIETKDPDPTGRRLRAVILASVRAISNKNKKSASLWRSFTELNMVHPKLLNRLSKPYQKMMPFKIKQGLPKQQELLVLLALDGLWSNDGVHSVKMSQSERNEMVSILIQMTKSPIKLPLSKSVTRGSKKTKRSSAS